MAEADALAQAVPAPRGSTIAVPEDDDLADEDFADLQSFLAVASGPAPGSEAQEASAVPTGEAESPVLAAAPGLGGGLVGEENAEVDVTLAEGLELYAVENWEDLGLAQELLDGIYEFGYTKPAKIQAWTMPLSLQGGDIIAQALNGSGKTAAFALSMLAKVNKSDQWCQGICLCHTRELATQNHDVIQKLGKHCGLEYGLCVAGNNPRQVLEHVVVGTPGKLNDLIKRWVLDVRGVKVFVIDEADHMIDQDQSGTQVVGIRQQLPQEVQILLFSATWPEEVANFAASMAPKATKIMVKKEDLTLADIQQCWVDIPDEGAKIQALQAMYAAMTIGQSIIFVNARHRAFKVAKAMKEAGYTVSLICGTQAEGKEKMELWQRDKIMTEFRSGVTKVLVATDILARGIDVPAVTMVVNYDVPVKQQYDEKGYPNKNAPRIPDTESYLHRIGRTGRFGLKGVAINFVPPKDRELLEGVKRHYGCEVRQLSGDAEEIAELMKR